ncbi:uncharacterized protein VTP21DRAFT_3111 [Calcarisporiella thermophila]|uniref:uncharacterized protein n=1 Tax=Calcarisporiella thermophila TaxID=911321 RepID=UPI003742301E
MNPSFDPSYGTESSGRGKSQSRFSTPPSPAAARRSQPPSRAGSLAPTTPAPTVAEGDNVKEEMEEEEEEQGEQVDQLARTKIRLLTRTKEEMKVLLDNFSPEQLERYEAFRRSVLNRSNVKRLVSNILNQSCSNTMAFVVAGFGKVFVGEMVEKAKEVMEEWGDQGPIRPEHLREAYRRYIVESPHLIPNTQYQRKLFTR